MIGDAQVRKTGRSGSFGHLLERRLTVAPVGMAMKGPREILQRDQVGKGSFFGGFDLARVLAQFGGISASPSALNRSASVLQVDLTAITGSAHTH